MAKIKITDEYCLEKGNHGWVLKFISKEVRKVRNPKTQEMIEKRAEWSKYYTTLAEGFRGFAREYYENSNSMEEVIQRVEEAGKIVYDAFKRIEDLDYEITHEYKVVQVST